MDSITDTNDTESGPAGKKKDKSKQQRMLIIIGVVGLILTYVMLKRMSANNAAAGTTTADTTDDSSAVAQNEASDAANIQTLGQDMSSIQAQVAGLTSMYGSGDGQTGTPTGVTSNPPPPTGSTTTVNPGGPMIPAQSVQGAGYWGGSAGASTPITTPGGGVFDYISSWTNAQAIQEAGGTVDFQAAPGVFTSAYGSNGQLLPALTQPGEAPTPLYTVGSPNAA